MKNINIFTQETLYPFFIWKKSSALHRKRFSEHPLFTLFSVFLKRSEVCNTWSKWWLPNKSAWKIFLHKTPYTPPSFEKNNWALHRRIFQKHPLYTTILLVFTEDEVCNITNKIQHPSNLGKYQYFYTRDLLSFLHFNKNLVLFITNGFWNIHFLPHF